MIAQSTALRPEPRTAPFGVNTECRILHIQIRLRTRNALAILIGIFGGVCAHMYRSGPAKEPSAERPDNHPLNSHPFPVLRHVTDWLEPEPRAAITPEVGSLQEAIESGQSKVLAVAITRRLSPLLGDRDAAAVFVASAWPVAFHVVLGTIWPSARNLPLQAYVWFLALAGLNSLMLRAASRAWNHLLNASGDLERMTTAKTSNRLASYLKRYLSTFKQVSIAVAVAAAGLTLLLFVRAEVQEVLPLVAASYIAVAWTAVLGSNVAYWLVVMGLFPWKMSKEGGLCLWQTMPAYTPGIVRLVHGYKYALSMLLAGAIAIEVLIFLVPTIDGATIIPAISVAFAVVAVVVATIVGMVPFYALRRLVRGRRYQLMFGADSAVIGSRDGEALAPSNAAGSKEERTIRLVQGPDLPLERNLVVPFAAAMLGSLIPFLLSTFAFLGD